MQRWTQNSASAWRKLRPLGLMLMLLTPMAGCTTMMGFSVPTNFIDTSCQAFKPIHWSKSDTAQTIKEVKAHNAAFKAICPLEPK